MFDEIVGHDGLSSMSAIVDRYHPRRPARGHVDADSSARARTSQSIAPAPEITSTVPLDRFWRAPIANLRIATANTSTRNSGARARTNHEHRSPRRRPSKRGSAVRVELSTDEDARTIEADLTREQQDDLALAKGQDVYIRVTALRVFDPVAAE